MPSKPKWRKAADEEIKRCIREGFITPVTELGLVAPYAMSLDHTMTPHTFIADSGGSSHMCKSPDGMTNLENRTVPVKFGAGRIERTAQIGSHKGPSQ